MEEYKKLIEIIKHDTEQYHIKSNEADDAYNTMLMSELNLLRHLFKKYFPLCYNEFHYEFHTGYEGEREIYLILPCGVSRDDYYEIIENNDELVEQLDPIDHIHYWQIKEYGK